MGQQPEPTVTLPMKWRPQKFHTSTLHPSSLLFSWLQPNNILRSGLIIPLRGGMYAHTGRSAIHSLHYVDYIRKSCWIFPLTAPFSSLKVSRNNKTHQPRCQNCCHRRALHHEPWSPAAPCTMKCCELPESRKRNSCCVSGRL